ncbi:hypothetical protein CTEN210_00891 [Chaetoceros tenuissimus]|uniref:Uncharacterized protein n=1 Tax=Chaetoceros tenuissimus TaxID=426638 RepID=A0AAD3GYU2_9STRA|nr:hypothetical protein CTEN210_00891 [Chaetoceros tenuissimus]
MSLFANEVEHGDRCSFASCVDYDVEEVQSMLGESSTTSTLPTIGRTTCNVTVVKREKRQYILLTLVALFLLCAVVVLMRQSTGVLEDEVDIPLTQNSANVQFQEKNVQNLEFCQRKCPTRKKKNIIYYVDNPAGLGDRKTVMRDLAQLAGFLCAKVVLPPPAYLLTPVHNNDKLVSENLVWQDFYNLTFQEDYEPAIQDARNEFGYDFTNWRNVPLFNTQSHDSKYNGWLHVVSKHDEWKDDYYKILDYSYLNGSEDEYGFIWELKGSLYDADIFEELRLNGPSADVLSLLPKNSYKPKMRPHLDVYCGINGIQDCRGCVYTNEDVDPTHLQLMKKRLEKRIRNQALDNAYLGHLHIRRGDAIDDCDTSVDRMEEYFQCSLDDTESLGRNITLLMTSDEGDSEYREEILSLINDEDRYPHVSILDSDKMVKSIMKDAIESDLISKDMLNNYFVFDVEYLLQDWSSTLMDFHLVRRRTMCRDCIRLKKRLGNLQQ